MVSVWDSIHGFLRGGQYIQALELMETWVREAKARSDADLLTPFARDIDLMFAEANRVSRDIRRQTISDDVRSVKIARLSEGLLDLAENLQRFASRMALVPHGDMTTEKPARPDHQAAIREVVSAGDEPGHSRGAEPAATSDQPYKPTIFISYAHADEPEKVDDGETKWLSFVTGFLRPLVKRGAVDLWIDRIMRGGDDWNQEIKNKLRSCDIFVLLVSHNSMSSDYVVDKEISIIRDRQAKGEDVHFYPLLLTPTPKFGLDLVRDKNLRPRDAKPFSSYSLNDRFQHMAEATDEIATIVKEIAARKGALAESPRARC
jgi:hypothetical protein